MTHLAYLGSLAATATGERLAGEETIGDGEEEAHQWQ